MSGSCRGRVSVLACAVAVVPVLDAVEVVVVVVVVVEEKALGCGWKVACEGELGRIRAGE